MRRRKESYNSYTMDFYGFLLIRNKMNLVTARKRVDFP
jgi:hypothetical protein